MASSTSPASHLIERLKSSPFYQICQDSFRKATGLPLVIINAHDAQFNPCHTSPNQNPFCRGLNLKHGTCEECKQEQKLILSRSNIQTYTHTCFAGLKETSVPLRLGKETIAFLKTGQVFTEKPMRHPRPRSPRRYWRPAVIQKPSKRRPSTHIKTPQYSTSYNTEA